MLEKIKDSFEGIKMTIVSGVFLLLSLALLITRKFVEINLNEFIDPAIITIIISGYPIVYIAFKTLIKEHRISSCLLITIAMIASLAIKEVFASGEVVFIMAIGEILEDLTVDRAKKGIDKLINLSPKTGRLVVDNDEKIIDVLDVKIDDILRILPGETIPVDGKIIKGNASINQSVLTGESLPLDKTIDDSVYSGTLNENGSIDILVTSLYKDSSLEKMISLLKEAENKEAPMKRIADKWAGILVPVSCLIAILTFIITYFIMHFEFYNSLIRGVTILVVFCPCALSLATPTSIMASIGQATKYGVLIKSGKALEEMSRTNVITFDKTGTLTLGKLHVSDIITNNNFDSNELLKIASSIENRSEHPIAKAIALEGKNNNITNYDIENFVNEPGKGISAEINNTKYFLGNEKYIIDKNVTIDESFISRIDNIRNEEKAVIIISNLNEILGAIALSDTIRDNSKEIIRELKNMNYEVVLLTGDNKITANYIGSKLGIENIKSDLLPLDKVNTIESLKENNRVVMVGEGLNDAPALKTANVGVVLGGIGSDISIDASDIVVLDDDISKIPYIAKLSKETVKTIKFSITLSMIINFVAVLLSALGILNPITGAIVHNVGSVLIVLNASLLYDKKIYKK